MSTPRDPDRPDWEQHQPGYGPQPGYGAPEQGGAGQEPPPYDPGQPPYGYDQGLHGGPPGYGGPGGPFGEPPKGFAIASLVLGILGFITSCVVLGVIPGIIAVILGVVGVRKAASGSAGGRGMAIAGLILGVLSILLAVILGAILAWTISLMGPAWRECTQLEDPQAVNRCLQENIENRTSLASLPGHVVTFPEPAIRAG